jgi:hypothetical protein
MKVKPRQRIVDRKNMVGQVLSRWAASLLLIVALGGLLQVTGLGADAQGAEIDDSDQPIDINVLRMKAEAGDVSAQTMLADSLAGSSDFTNAVVWYRKAAEKGDVGAQLSLASLLITGRGTAKDPQEAAKWLRQAANGIESAKPVVTSGTSAAVVPTNPAPGSIIMTKASIAAATNHAMIVTQNLSNPARVQRVTVLHAPEPVLQDIRPALRPPSEPR